jgi:hypothetical protein
MRLLIVEPGYSPYIAHFKSAAEARERVIKGESKILHPFDTDRIALICSAEQQNQAFNRQMDAGFCVYGRFYICGWDGKNEIELTKKQADRYFKKYVQPERLSNSYNTRNIEGLYPRARPLDERLGKRSWFMER